MRKSWPHVLLAFIVLCWSLPALAAKIRFRFDGWEGPTLNVYVSRPAGLAPDRPVVFVMHGMQRNADQYRDQWHELAMEHEFLLVVPEFSRRDFPGSAGYNLGNRVDSSGQAVARSRWTFSAIEPLFDDVRKRWGMSTSRYALYGHSAGAQFVHRFVFFVPDARVSRVVTANAGWYTMPDYQVAWPYGLGGTALPPEMLAEAFRKPVTVLLGERDDDPQHQSLRRTPEAMAQGPSRLDRGRRFFTTARAQAARMNVPFNWRMELVPGVGHDNRRMAPAAVEILLEEGPR
jgi:poly(3-hydroxybutyrate) depolymerase